LHITGIITTAGIQVLCLSSWVPVMAHRRQPETLLKSLAWDDENRNDLTPFIVKIAFLCCQHRRINFFLVQSITLAMQYHGFIQWRLHVSIKLYNAAYAISYFVCYNYPKCKTFRPKVFRFLKAFEQTRTNSLFEI